MNDHARGARNRLDAAQRDLKAAQAEVARIEAVCPHTYGAPVSDPIVRPGYRATSQSWHPGYGREEDFQVEVPEERTPRWARTCTTCGKVEHTTQVTEHKSVTPRF